MTKGKKRINPNSRGIIDSLKNKMRFAPNPFDGGGHPFKTAISELRKEGVEIKHNKNKQHYYNPKTVRKVWGY